ncbi:lysophospholipid acyltransferase family protein [Sphingomonas rubra]|uniref:1-acyl-sn-glycerol-3-phosphate acyltransferase n=1 Tax=Sphingomonas rubra TaxID=634430 RepID=A0A1I5TXJ2_9SPHN|nr:lysophospholipid acyltransferase family protein [Sphingomonas rubra]SFP87337.1 1-acyl-sn-glycerol-3-phosphate acyltransferase [Sphingomonas rubra]
MTWLRNIAFAIVFYGGSVPIVLATPVSALFGQRAVIANATLWTRFHAWAVRWLLGIRVVVEGERPAGPALYAAKHQSMWETLELQQRLDGPAMVLKRELTRIPVWGWAAVRYGAIPVDRDASAAALRRMMKAGQAARAQGRSVFIFPEGTRVPPGEAPPLKSGFAGLYRAIGLPVVPVALDAGRLWPKRGLKRAGTITLRYGKTIPAGLPRAEIERLVHTGMNALEPAAQPALPPA